MRGPLLLAVSALALGVALPALDCAAQSSEPADARIMKMKCSPAWFKRDKERRQLSERQDSGLRLRAKDEVQCSGEGFIELLLPAGFRQIRKTDGNIVIAPIDSDPQYTKEIVNDLKKLGVPGATRGHTATSRILWPVEGSAAAPEHFSVRWPSAPGKIRIAVLTESKDTTVFGPAEVEGTSGSFQSPTLSAALAALQAKAPNPQLVVTITFGDANDWEESHFSLLGARQKQQLAADLDFWDKHATDLALHLGRGYVYSKYRLFAEAADEYDSALSAAPESPSLLDDAIEANLAAARTPRAKELQSRRATVASRTPSP